jgi:hypothetical protein
VADDIAGEGGNLFVLIWSTKYMATTIALNKAAEQ